MRIIILILLPFMALFLQSTIFSFFSIKGAVPDLILIFVIFYSLLNPVNRAGLYGLFCGLLEDLYTGRFIGMNALAKGFTAYILGSLQANVFKDNILVAVVSIIFGSLLNIVLLLIVSLILPERFNLDLSILFNMLFHVLYNTVLAIPIYMWYYNSHRSGLLRETGER